MSGYRVVYVEQGKPAVEKEIGTKLENLQEAVGNSVAIPCVEYVMRGIARVLQKERRSAES